MKNREMVRSGEMLRSVRPNEIVPYILEGNPQMLAACERIGRSLQPSDVEQDRRAPGDGDAPSAGTAYLRNCDSAKNAIWFNEKTSLSISTFELKRANSHFFSKFRTS
jgi:hypothetical protein